MAKAELLIVVPVFNEAGTITQIVHQWLLFLNGLDINYRFLLLNDGSTDNSLEVLYTLANQYPGVEVATHKNMGHGPTILEGYKRSGEVNWIFQMDADNPYETNTFAIMWKLRESYDFLVGNRKIKSSTSGRKMISSISVLTTWFISGRYIHDINTPYRLMRGNELNRVINIIPYNSFAPNILITLYFYLKKKRIYTVPLIINSNLPEKKSRLTQYMMKGAITSFFQTLQFRFRL